MLALRYRLAIAGIVTATAVAVPVAALASGPGSPAGKPSPTQVSSSAGKSPAPASAAERALAASAGISVARLEAGLGAAKQAGGNTAGGVAAFAATTGVSRATAQRVVNAVFGSAAAGEKAPSGTGASAAKSAAAQHQLSGLPEAASALAARLGVSTDTAQRAVKEISRLIVVDGRVDTASPAFAAIAHDIGVSHGAADGRLERGQALRDPPVRDARPARIPRIMSPVRVLVVDDDLAVLPVAVHRARA